MARRQVALRPPPSGTVILTPRERQVSRLAAAATPMARARGTPVPEPEDGRDTLPQVFTKLGWHPGPTSPRSGTRSWPGRWGPLEGLPGSDPATAGQTVPGGDRHGLGVAMDSIDSSHPQSGLRC